MFKWFTVPLCCCAFASSAATLECSIKPSVGHKKLNLNALATISPDEARKVAMTRFTVNGAAIVNGGIELEEGCLVYSYDIKVPGKAGVEEILIDAGTGKVLRTEHERALKEKLEKLKRK